MTFSLSLLLGFISTIGFFVLSYVVVVGAKTLYVAIKKFFPKKEEQITPPPVKEQAPKKPKIVKSIEIDPALVDKIYVKKSS